MLEKEFAKELQLRASGKRPIFEFEKNRNWNGDRGNLLVNCYLLTFFLVFVGILLLVCHGGR